MKIFKIREDGGEQQALDRLTREMQILQQNRPGLPKLLDSSESERWIVTEYFPRGTVENNISLYKGKPALALKAFLSLVNTVAQLHDEDIVHRDIKPANVFVRQDDDLVLGDFGIVYLPDQPVRLTRTNESVGPHDYMPPWTDVGGRLESVHTNFDVYMLGKLLWCMVSGRLLLQREWFRRPQNDVCSIFRHDPHTHMINTILDKCVVENPEECISIHDLRAMVIANTSSIDQGGQLLQDEVPRPCHVCGVGEYQPELFRRDNPTFNMRFWNLSGSSGDISLATVRLFVCSICGHMAFFRTSPR
jgi:serine/threonine protein kinase